MPWTIVLAVFGIILAGTLAVRYTGIHSKRS